MFNQSFKSAIMKNIFVLAVLSLPGFSCMKNRCYECKDTAGNIKEKGCDKPADEIVTYGQAQGWECEILPDWFFLTGDKGNGITWQPLLIFLNQQLFLPYEK